ncbi:DUF2254 domain-containing protein [Neolewinella lacunae]|uniref:DUF2254 domain-containing protein n=1 Tax=Neolewinella lacunae TaxID=1517758 RepID=A0A923PL44_9BACT|nr:DUF2254 domain-containing protein [Neolewinella lacunae]MBC6995369.1 DUF2254 domain-containing protein [Neolewinella lacunae]MDN3633081.1 DUF2254 domain-containing protein [Neolewinella lacunae]
MQDYSRWVLGWIKNLGRSVAFLPAPMMFAGMVIGIGLYYFETNTDISAKITESFPAVMVSSQETARNILGLFIGGLITLVVFTFTQLMNLFNQVANSYSPRLLPFFTGDRSLQFTMGFYLGTIILTLIVLLSIRGNDDGYVPNLSVLICIVLGIASLGIFIYFVTTVSRKIQVDNLIRKIHQLGLDFIDADQAREGYAVKTLPADLGNWYVVPSPIDGFIGTVNFSRLSELAAKYETQFYLSTAKGEYLPKGHPLFQSQRVLKEEEVQKVLSAVAPITQKFDDWYLPTLRLLVEIAMKAMSPGINDPGTALDAIDRIHGMLGHLLGTPIPNHYAAEKGGAVWFTNKDLPAILNDTLSHLRTYCRADVVVSRKLMKMLFQLLSLAQSEPAVEAALREEIQALAEDIGRHITNAHDRATIAREVWAYRAFVAEFPTEMDFLGVAGGE